MAEKIYLCNIGFPGETAEAVARATASQYDKEQIEIVRVPYIDSESQIDEVIDDAKSWESCYLSYHCVCVFT